MKTEYDVLILGCGPTGAVLANYLRKTGYTVAIFDRMEEVFHAPRAMVIDDESCRILDDLDVLHRLVEEDASPFENHEFLSPAGKLLMRLDMRDVGAPLGHHAAGMMFHQPSLERFLRDDFSKGERADAFFGAEVTECVSTDTHAELTARLASGKEQVFRGQYLIGADGGNSFCRKQIKANRIDLNYRKRWVVIDITIHDNTVWDAMPEGSRFICQPDASIVFVKGHHNHARLDVEAGDEWAARFSEQDALEILERFIDPASVEFLRLEPYNFYAGMPDVWRKGRMILAGDAAHQTPPFSGQGLNMGLRDAANLAFKLDMVLSGKASDTFLDTYQQERWENCRRLIVGAIKRGEMISAGDWLSLVKRNFGFFMGRMFPKLALEATKNMSDRVDYDAGFIGTSAIAGSVFPQPEVVVENECILLDSVLGSGLALVSVVPASGPEVEALTREFGARCLVIGQDFDDPSGTIMDLLSGASAKHVLVRPDRYVFDASDDANELCGRAINAMKTGYEGKA